MSSLTVIVRILFVMSMLIVSSGQVGADILYPPTKIIFAKDVLIEKYAQGQPLKLFKYNGKWDVKTDGKSLSLIGTSDEVPVYLISNDKLSRKPKSFKLDFVIKDINKEFGFIYGDIGIIIISNKLYPASFDTKANILKISSSNSKTINQVLQGKSNTLDINTGYDPTGGSNQVCVIYINGEGLTFECPNKDNNFGVYLSPKNSIKINMIRWGIGSK